MIDKLVVEDGVLGVTAVRRHDTVTVVLGSANRDTVLAADGENFNIARPAVRHLGFGFGAHHCLGAGLARLEVASALSVFAARFPDMAITGPLTWRPNHRLRAPERLDLRLVPVAAGREPTLTTP
jgi:cytochrome P450